MAIILVRHAEAEDRALGTPDPERTLVAAGRRAARATGRALAALKVEPECVVTSPYPRARETAEIIAEELGAPVADDAVLLGVEADDLAALAERHGENLVLVGHEPDLSVLLLAVTGTRVSFPKAGAAAIEPLTGQRGELRWFLRPRALALIAGGV
ncbi:MAG: histidine phosphatase family protein [Actinomycetota bacterium]|nr:histidine phosphatase family protein [Actinomycetota bacterium]